MEVERHQLGSRASGIEGSQPPTEHKIQQNPTDTDKKLPSNDAYCAVATANSTCNTEKPEKLPEDNATNTDEARSRIESFSNQLKARSPSFLGESHDTHDRTESVGARGARRPSIIKGQETESNNQQAVGGRPVHIHKRRLKAINKTTNQDNHGATGMTESDIMVPENQNKADPVNQTKARHDSSSSAESICQSGSSVSSYEADPEFPLSQTEVSVKPC